LTTASTVLTLPFEEVIVKELLGSDVLVKSEKALVVDTDGKGKVQVLFDKTKLYAWVSIRSIKPVDCEHHFEIWSDPDDQTRDVPRCIRCGKVELGEVDGLGGLVCREWAAE